jgi:hypothetical protein
MRKEMKLRKGGSRTVPADEKAPQRVPPQQDKQVSKPQPVADKPQEVENAG